MQILALRGMSLSGDSSLRRNRETGLMGRLERVPELRVERVMERWVEVEAQAKWVERSDMWSAWR